MSPNKKENCVSFFFIMCRFIADSFSRALMCVLLLEWQLISHFPTCAFGDTDIWLSSFSSYKNPAGSIRERTHHWVVLGLWCQPAKLSPRGWHHHFMRPAAANVNEQTPFAALKMLSIYPGINNLSSFSSFCCLSCMAFAGTLTRGGY